MLLSAYRQGIFPWFSAEDPILWWSPDPRFVIFSGEVHVSRSMERVLRRGTFEITFDADFAGVISGCASSPRPGQDGTWITEDMEIGYRRLHELGYAHSCETRLDGELVGGVYGVSLGRMFFGESMFSRVSNASKVALISLCRFLDRHGFLLLDAQLHTPHVERLGGREIPRAEFLSHLRRGVAMPGMVGNWRDLAAQ